MTTRILSARLKLLAASTCALFGLSVGCVDLSEPWDNGLGGAGGKSEGSGGAVGVGGLLSDGPAIQDLAFDAGSGGIPGPAAGSGGAVGWYDGGDLPSLGSGGIPETGSGGAVGFTGDASASEAGPAQGGAGGPVTTGGVSGKGGSATGGRGGVGGAVILDGRPALDTASDAAPDSGLEVGRDVAADAPIGPPDVARDLGMDLGVDLGPDADPLLVGLVAYYKCDESDGDILSDSSGLGHHGTLHGGASLGSPGKVGKGLTLPKSGSSYAWLPAEVFAGRKNVTVATWVQVSSLDAWARIFDTGIDAKVDAAPTTATKYMGLTAKSSNTNNLRFFISVDGFLNEQSLNASSALSTGVWQHVAIVLEESSSQGRLYLDGTLAASDGTSLQPDDLGALDYAFLGKSQFSVDPYFDGMIDEFRVYDRALSASEVQDLYHFTGP